MQDITTLKAERDQLIARIAEIDTLIAAATATGYEMEETTETKYGTERTAWRITLNGRPVHGATFTDRQIAEDMLSGLRALPENYSLSYDQDGRLGWKFIARRNGRKIAAHENIGTVIQRVNEDLAAIPGRLARAAERKAEEEKAETAAAEAERIAAERALLATPRQVSFILTLLAEQPFKAFPEPGFVSGGPTEKSEIEKLTKEQASAYISSLKGNY